MIIVQTAAGTLSPSDLITARYRTDLVPVPVSLELVTKRTTELTEALALGQLIQVGEQSLKIIKSSQIKSDTIQDDQLLGGIAVTAIPDGLHNLIYPASRAIILRQTGFAQAYRASGAGMRILRDIPLPDFVCLRGQIPTTEIARRLQQECAVMAPEASGLEVVRLDDLMKAEPVAALDAAAVQWQDNPHATTRQIPQIATLAPDGSLVTMGQPDQPTVIYQPRLDGRRNRNMQRVLCTRATISRPMDKRFQAGRIVQVGDRRLVILTTLDVVTTGAMGGGSAAMTQCWLAMIGER